MRFVSCALCSESFQLAVPDEQTFVGRGCSVFLIYRRGRPLLLGCFGSRYDESLFQVFRELTLGPDEPVCDVCVDRMSAVGDIRQIPGTFLRVPTDFKPPAHQA